MVGYNGTIFAYGQTGTGKTYTMSGDSQDFLEKGIMPRAFEDIMKSVQELRNEEQLSKITVKASYLEIYNEDIRDLLSSDPK